MSDRHLRILATIASRSQRAATAHDTPSSADEGQEQRQAELRLRASRTRAQLAAARARRLIRPRP